MPITYKLLPLSDLFDEIKDKGFNKTSATTSFYKALDAYCTESKCRAPSPDQPKPKPAQVILNKTNSYGGTTGGDFDWSLKNPIADTDSIIIRSDNYVQNIQLTLSDGINTVFSPKFGGTGGTERTPWKVPAGEHITQVEVRSGGQVDSLTFITNKGNKSPKYGGNGGTYFLVTFPAGYRLVGLFGKQGSYLGRLGFVIAKTTYSSGEIEDIKHVNLVREE